MGRHHKVGRQIMTHVIMGNKEGSEKLGGRLNRKLVYDVPECVCIFG